MKVLDYKMVVSKLFRRPKVLMAACGIAAVFCLMASKFLLSAHYVAAGKILVSTDIIGEGSPKEELALSDRVLNTTAELLRSRSFTEEVVKELNLEDAFGPKAVDKLQSMVSVKPVKGTDVIKISVRSKKGELATLIANTICKTVITRSAKDRFSLEKDIVSWFSREASVIKGELEEARANLLKFKESVGAADLEAGYNAAMQRLSELENNLSAARARKGELEPAYVGIKESLEYGKKLEELPAVINDSGYKQLQSEYNSADARREELLKRYQPSHPQVAALAERLAELKASLGSHAEKLVSDIITGYEKAGAKEEELRNIIGEENRMILNLEGKVNEYKQHLDGLREKEAIFNAFLEKAESKFAGGLRLQQLSLAEQAYLPKKKEAPPAAAVILAGLLLGAAATLIYNILKDKDALFIEKTNTSLPPGERKTPPPPGKAMYIERVEEEDKRK